MQSLPQLGPGSLGGLVSRVKASATAEMQRFNADEDGLDIIEKILVLFVCVVILIGLLLYFNQNLWTSVKSKVAELIGASGPSAN